MGWTALMVAAAQGDSDLMDAIIGLQLGRASDLDVDAVDKEGKTALIHAASHGHDECARLLLSAGADASLRAFGSGWPYEGMTALEVARAAQITPKDTEHHIAPGSASARPDTKRVEGAAKVEALLEQQTEGGVADASSTRSSRDSSGASARLAAVRAMEPAMQLGVSTFPEYR